MGEQKPHGGTTKISIEIASLTPARVMLELDPQAESTNLGTHGLRALDPDTPPLADITFESDCDRLANLRILIPEGQPPDTYTGVVFDRETGRPRGTLCVHLAE